MIGFDRITLIKSGFEDGPLGQKIPTETKREVFARIQSISEKEFFSAGQIGLKPEIKIILSTSFDYDGEKIVQIGDDRYAVYRTYKIDPDYTTQHATGGQMELYLTKETGVKDGQEA